MKSYFVLKLVNAIAILLILQGCGSQQPIRRPMEQPATMPVPVPLGSDMPAMTTLR